MPHGTLSLHPGTRHEALRTGDVLRHEILDAIGVRYVSRDACDLLGRHDLAGVTLGMLRRMEQQANHRRRQLGPADATNIGECRRVRRSELFERAFDRGVKRSP
jgi:hypothetical protein